MPCPVDPNDLAGACGHRRGSAPHAIIHPNVVRVLGVILDHPNFLAMVMELADLGSLRQMLDDDGERIRSQPALQLSIAHDICAGMAHLHAKKPKPIMHNDLKSSNILLDGEGYVRVTDFNVAKLLDERRTFSMKGTLFCMAPEVILKKGHDASADFWSYGVLIYELLTGGPPFYSSDKQELKRQILGMDPRRFNLAFPPDMPTACRMLLSQLLVREPRLRLGA